jgi:hypothetical protein
MATAAIHVFPDSMFEDWIICEDGRELGHYPTMEAGQLIGETVARERAGNLVVHLPGGKTENRSFRRAG